MVAPSNIGLPFRGNFPNPKKKSVDKVGEFLKMSFNSSCNTCTLNNKQRFSLLVSVSSPCSPWKVNSINKMKHVLLAPGMLANESNAKTASVTFLRGMFVEDRFVYRQIFVVRSYQIGSDKTVTMETLMNFLQETALNQVSSCGLSKNDFGITHEMDLRKLIWVVTRIQIQVKRYSKWGDEVEVDTWFDAAGKSAIRRDWIIRDHYTKEMIAKATSTWTIMNRETRRLSKIPEEVRQELAPFYFNRISIPTEEIDHQKIHKLTDDITKTFRSGIAPKWNDMDVNEHVNNVKYIGWILESMPREVLDNYNMTSMTIEFRRECTQSNVLESMSNPSSSVIGASDNNSVNRKPGLQYTHLLRLQDNKAELVRARTEWNLKQKR
ncbi:palmitoyl-acyl carrier protein thioesterase, chloroplastic-like [Abrus precatorius]|uniref:Acyl-[acyl-carrier-protein] hydrolase n=1 Tax=Abrus precatorius TaxID=3816 RepID=A0A8B8LWN8_ABRPR|nr:palmitoyl-acyl carrier protein thioesterase, chloroplastic-like [Abrus precatorius]